MKKILLVVSAFLLTFSLSACDLFGGEDTPTLEIITIAGVEDATVEEGEIFNVFTGITAMGDDDTEYKESVIVDSETCVIDSEGNVDTSSAKTCEIEYSVVISGVFAKGSMTLTITPKEIIVEGAPLLISWDFEDADELLGWNIYTAGTGALEISIDSGAMKMVTVPGGQRYETRLDYQGVPLEEGYDYKVSFKAKADVDGKMVHLNFGELLSAAPYFTAFKPEMFDIITLTQEWVEYSYTFNMENANVNGGPLFEMGDMEGSAGISATIWIDDLKIEGGSGTDTAAPMILGADQLILNLNDTFDATAGVTANDLVDGDLTTSIEVTGANLVDTSVNGVYTVTYTVEDAAGNDVSLERTVVVADYVMDPNNNDTMNVLFDTDTVVTDLMGNDWYKSVSWGTPIFNAETVAGKLVMTSAKDGEKDFGTSFWDHIVRYHKMTLVKGATYKIEFDAMTDEDAVVANNMMVKTEAGSFVAEQNLTVVKEGTHVEYIFHYTGDTTTAGSFLFFVGGREHVITIENLEIYTTPQGASTDTEPMVSGNTDITVLSTDTFDLLTGITATDVEDGDITLVTADVTVVGPNAETTFDLSIPGEWTVTYSVTDSDSNTVTVERKVTVYDVSGEPELVSWDFTDETDLTGWTIDNSVSAITAVVENGELKLSYTSGTNTWEPRAYFMNVPFEDGYTYVVQFDAKSSVEDKIIHLQSGEILSADPWFDNFFAEGQSEYAAITTDYVTYYYVFTMTQANSRGGILFELGNFMDSVGISGDVFLDNIVIYGGSGTDTAEPVITGAEDVILTVGDVFDALTGVTAMDMVDGDLTSEIQVTGTVDTAVAGSITITYTVTDAAGNLASVDRVVAVVGLEDDPINSGEQGIFDADTVLDFDNTQPWYLATGWGAPAFSASTTNGLLTIEHYIDGTNDFGSNFWDDIVRYDNLVLLKGATYRVTIDASTSLVGNTEDSMILKVENGDTGFWEGYDVFLKLDETTQTYILQFTWGYENTTNGLILLQVGKVEQTLEISNLTVSADFASISDSAQFFGITEEIQILVDEAFVADDGVVAVDPQDGLVTDSMTITVVGPNAETTFDSSVEGEWTFTYEYTDADTNVAQFVTTLTVVGDADAPELSGLDNGYVVGGFAWNPLAGVAFTDLDETLTMADFVVEVKDNADAVVVADANGLYTLANGVYSVSYTLTDATGNAANQIVMINVVDAPTVTNNMLLEGDFTGTLTAWASWADGSAAVTYDNSSDALVVDITSVGGEFWAIQYNQETVDVLAGKTYAIVFEASSTVDRDILIEMIDGNNQWSASLKDTTQRFVLTYTAGADKTAAKLNFLLGAVNGAGASVITIDNVMVYEVTANPNLVQEADFSGTLTAWASWTDAAVTFDNSSDALVADVTNVGGATWSVQYYQEGIAFTAGSVYTISFDASAAVDRDIFFEVIDGNNQFAASLTSTPTTFTYSFFATADNANAKINFLLGNVNGASAGAITIDNVLIQEMLIK